jgi:glycine/D-amino acid oxidase-like deaminating enzyme
MDRARSLCTAAQIAIDVAAEQVTEAMRLQSERRRWLAVWSDCCASADHVIVCCAYCGGIRTPEGEWGTIPAGMSQVVYQSLALRLSHGICPDCIAWHFPK